MQEKRLHPFGHVEGREENYIEKRIERMTVEDNKERGRTKMETLSDKGPEVHNRTAWLKDWL